MQSLTKDRTSSAIEFQTELHGESTLSLPPEVVERLPKSGRATVVRLVQDDADDQERRQAVANRRSLTMAEPPPAADP